MHTIPLKVAVQNAGLLVYRRADIAYFESFELSAQAHSVTGTLGRLVCAFPGVAIAIPVDKLHPSFIATLSQTIDRMSGQVAPGTQPTSYKGGRSHDEFRDTAHPKMVTELLTAFALPLGHPAKVTGITKHVRDEVLWDSCKSPWRRSPMWTLIRVSIQLVLLRSGLDALEASVVYKHFMVYFMAHALRKTALLLKNDLSCLEWCDLVYVMKAKISRRLLKIEKIRYRSTEQKVQKEMIFADKLLRGTWDAVQKSRADKSRVDVASLRHLDFKKDTFASLPQLDDFIDSISNRESQTVSAVFNPVCPLPEINQFTHWHEPVSDSATFQAAWLDNLLGSHLSEWLEPKLRGEVPYYTETFKALWRVMSGYKTMVSSRASDNPEAMSMMTLGVLELWAACDKLACHTCPLLSEYDPVIDAEYLQGLLLPTKQQMERLAAVEKYIISRKERGKRSGILTSFGKPQTFAVRYFEQSPTHESLCERIEAAARKTREDKAREFQRTKQQYTTLINQYNSTDCDVEYNKDGDQQHPRNCKRCKTRKRAKGLSILIHEWPLPEVEAEKRNVIFELDVPAWFSVWRQATTFVLFDVFKKAYEHEGRPSGNSKYALRNDIHLGSYYCGIGSAFTPRIGLLSGIKAHSKSHYKPKLISTVSSADDLYYTNGLRYQYYDESRECFVGTLSRTSGIDVFTNAITYALPRELASMQQFLYRPCTSPDGPSPNLVIATQSDCPDHLSLTEYKALCTIPHGHRIQWQNILLQVTAPNVDFKRVETTLIVLQCIYQAGPRQGGLWHRAAHEVPAMAESFGERMMEGLRAATNRIRDNWQCVNALATYIAVARRILSLTDSELLRRDVLKYLSEARSVGLGWIKSLKTRADDTTDDGEKTQLRGRIAYAALVCVDTCNFEGDILRTILESNADTAAVDFIECCITINECYAPGSSSDQSALSSIFYWRWQMLCTRACPILANLIVDYGNDGLDIAVKRSWVSYNASPGGWNRCSIPGCSHSGMSWLTTKSISPSGRKPLDVHYCVVTGELRVNGVPLNRLPAEYERNPMYKRLFGNCVLEVMPADVPGMIFSGKKLFAGHEVHFGCVEDAAKGQELLVRAVRDGRDRDLVHPVLLQGLPEAFTRDYVHWYDVGSNTVEFCPLSSPWTSSENNWKLSYAEDGVWQLTQREDRILVAPKLLNPESQTASRLAGVFSPLVKPGRLHLIYRPLLSVLDIEIPTLKLAFHLHKGWSEITSHQFRGMTVDREQEIGTLFGLDNKLVLKASSDDTYRKVIILEGPVRCFQSDPHMRVHFNTDDAVRVHAYDVDTRLGRLVDNGSLESKLLICHLHALTSFCLPDPLTQRTGTERALDILNSAAVKSFAVLTPENTEALSRIARLTPWRTYYPKEKTVMQTVGWSSSLGFLSQHHSFLEAVTSLFSAAADRAFLYEDQYQEPPEFERHNRDLILRDSIRASTFRVAEYGAEAHTTEHDRFYYSRDVGQTSDEIKRAFTMADYIYHRRTELPYDLPLDVVSSVWNFLSRASKVYGLGYHLDLETGGDKPEYDASWLLEGTDPKIIGRSFILYHEAISLGASSDIDRFDLMMWLSTMAFSQEGNMAVIQVLAAMANVSKMASVNPPTADQFHPSCGTRFGRDALLSRLRADEFYHYWYDCPEYIQSRNLPHSQRNEARERYTATRSRAMKNLVERAEEQWPCKAPNLAFHRSSGEWATYVKSSVAVPVIQEHTKTRYNNILLWDYLVELVDQLPSVSPPKETSLAGAKDSVLASEVLPIQGHRQRYVSKADIFLCRPPDLEKLVTPKIDLVCPPPPPPALILSSEAGQQFDLLRDMIEKLSLMASAAFEKDYIRSLRQSAESLALGARGNLVLHQRAPELLNIYHTHFRHRAEGIYSAIVGALYHHMATFMPFTSSSPSGEVCVGDADGCFATHWPRLSPLFLLQCIGRNKWKRLPPGWKECIVKYAVSLADVQRAERMLAADHRGDLGAMSRELQNVGHKNWNPLDYPDSLLLEVESSITIRDVQEEIAAQMRTPPKSENAVMQLNMGEGKSSVIVPIVAAALADGEKLVRVLVAKPQSKQMLQMLTSKMGGLLDRVVFQMPFSRALKVGRAEAQVIQRMLEQCRDMGGVLLVQPEHILSFQQMGTEYPMIPEKLAAGQMLNETRHFLFNNARDIVDESDENFSVKFELVYTIGNQQPVDHSPYRWQIIQEVLDIIRDIAPKIQEQFPDSIEIHDASAHPGSFPRTRILKREATQKLVDKLADRICDNGLTGFPISRQPPAVREAVRTYITKAELTEDEINLVQREGPSRFWTDAIRPTLVLLRGLMACHVLKFALTQKRWRVNYGLAPNRKPPTRLAVPYLAKDQPSARSEFSHPDVIIILSCLTYYYSGLSDDDLFLAFGTLLKSDQAEVEYDLWVRDNTKMPDKFKTLGGINIEDKHQCIHDVFPQLRFSKGVVDYFLSHIVYPKEMKEFPSKLSASGWDLGEKKVHPTTGFSGTNDSRRLLPLGMEQLDLEEQKHTNALVMSYLLQPETAVTDIPPRSSKQSSDADVLLDLVVGLNPSVRVILDVGAQVLELSNVEVAEQWLQRLEDDHTQAVVFFDNNDELSVLDRSGYIERLQTSPFASQLDVCLVFLDEAHTRGTDLKLPTNYRAAVTLGANQTKDGLMQGKCCRFRDGFHVDV